MFGFWMASEILTTIQILDSKNSKKCFIWWLSHFKPEQKDVWFLDDSIIRALGFWIPTTFEHRVGIWNPTIGNPDFLKVRFQMFQFTNCHALALAIAIVPTIQKPDHAKSGCFVQVSNGFDKMATIFRNSNGWTSRFQILFKIQTICNPTSFWPL